MVEEEKFDYRRIYKRWFAHRSVIRSQESRYYRHDFLPTTLYSAGLPATHLKSANHSCKRKRKRIISMIYHYSKRAMKLSTFSPEADVTWKVFVKKNSIFFKYCFSFIRILFVHICIYGNAYKIVVCNASITRMMSATSVSILNFYRSNLRALLLLNECKYNLIRWKIVKKLISSANNHLNIIRLLKYFQVFLFNQQCFLNIHFLS